MNEELQKLKEEFEERIRELEVKYNPKEEWPSHGEIYWAINAKGENSAYYWVDDGFDKTALENSAIFRTEEEAEFEAERLKVLRELEKIGKPFEIDGNNWSFCLNREYDFVFSTNYSYDEKFGSYYFNTEDEAKEAVQKIGADRIKKYLFGVEE